MEGSETFRSRRSGLASADVLLANQSGLSRFPTASETQSLCEAGSPAPQTPSTEGGGGLPSIYVSDESQELPVGGIAFGKQQFSGRGFDCNEKIPGDTFAYEYQQQLERLTETLTPGAKNSFGGFDGLTAGSQSVEGNLFGVDQPTAAGEALGAGDSLFADAGLPGSPATRFAPGTSPLFAKDTLHPGGPVGCPVPGMNLSFAGCGFLGIYHVGVSACLRKYAPELLVHRIAGASAGALAAACLLCDADMGVITSSVLKTATEARARALGPFSPTFDVEKLLREGLLTVLPANAHEIVSGRLFVSVTRVSDGKNVILSQFNTREELVQALLCSSFIPGFSGYRPLKINGVRYMDGGFSDNLPELDSATVTVSPFCGEADVCPKDRTAGLITISLANTSIEISRENLQRFARILFPPPPETLSKMCQQGFNDALDFLQRNNLIACTRCVAVQSTVPLDHSPEAVAAKEDLERLRKEKILAYQRRQDIVKERDWTELSQDSLDPEDDLSDYYEEWEMDCRDCADCRHQRQMALLDELPDAVGAVLQEAVEVADAGVTRWAAMSVTTKLVSLMALPATYSLRLPLAIMKGLRSRLPSVPTVQGMRAFTSQVTELARAVLLSRRHAAVTELPPEAATFGHHHHHRNKDSFSCNVAITEFSGMEGWRDGQRSHSMEFPQDQGVSGYDSESEALNRLAQQYAQRSARSASVVPQGLTLPLSRGPSRSASRAPSRAPSRAVSRAVSRRTSISMSRRTSVSESAFGGDSVYPHLHHQPYSTSDEEQDDGTMATDWDALSVNGTSFPPEDAFDRILNVTNDQDSLMAYYYLDENNQMQVTEIFDMSEVIPSDTHDIYDDEDGPHHHRPHSYHLDHHSEAHHHHHHHTPRRRTTSGILRNSISSTSGDNSHYQHQELLQDEQLLPKVEGQTADTHIDDDGGSDDERPGDGEEDSRTSQMSLSSSPPSEPEADQHLRS